MITFIIGVLLGVTAASFGVWVTAGGADLRLDDHMFETLHSTSKYSTRKVDKNRLFRVLLFRKKGLRIPLAVAGVLTIIVTLGLASVDQLNILTTVLLTIGSFVVGLFVTSRISQFKYMREPKLREKSEATYLRLTREERRKGTPNTKVYRCGVCGETSASGQYAVAPDGLALCPKHADLGQLTSYECPSCGYKFAEGYNEDYYKRHRCSNCGKELTEKSWG